MEYAPPVAVDGNSIRHLDSRAQKFIQEYLSSVEAGMSVLVRPQEAQKGFERVMAAFCALSTRATLVTDLGATSHVLDAADSETAVDEPIFGFHTSGSTGQPKCVIYERSTVDSHAATIASTLRLSEGWTYLALPPVRYAYGLSILNSHHNAGVPVNFLQADWGLSGVADLTRGTTKPLAIYLLPQHTPLLLSAGLESERVGRLIVAGGRLSGASVESLARAFPDARLDNMYGQAEMGPRLSMWSGPLAAFQEGNIGFPIPGVDLKLAGDPHDQQPREILARSRYSMRYMLTYPYEALMDGPAPREFMTTGDLGTRLNTGEIIHHGRSDRWLNVAGTRINLQAIERLIDARYRPLLVKATGAPARVSGDNIAVVEIVEGSRPVGELSAVRRALHEEFGGLASMIRLRVVERLSAGESGK